MSLENNQKTRRSNDGQMMVDSAAETFKKNISTPIVILLIFPLNNLLYKKVTSAVSI